jgi:signal transduction histidine kinase
VGALVAFTVAVLLLHQSFGLAAFADIFQAALLVSGTASFVPLVMRSNGRMRLFWSLIIFGLVLWLTYQLFWIYYEVVLRREVPDLFNGDVILFLNLVPLMAALALRPHAPRNEYASRLGRLDFALLLVWWFYLYVLIVLPWQYVVTDVATYNHNLNAAYSAEKLALLAGLAASWLGSRGQWRKLYASLFGMNLCYAASSALANWAIARNAYYSGSLYDIPLTFAMASLTWIGLRTKAEALEADGREVSTVYGVWVARLSMIAVFSLPLLATWAMSDTAVPPRIRQFRLALTLVAALAMGVMVFIRQHRLDRELVHLLNHSRDSVDNLNRLQAQILQSEKLASIGQLVGGAAHELNNPITAMLGYSDLLISTNLTAEQQPVAGKIGQYVRRTKALVASLISFARQSPARRTLIDLNSLARTAVKLTQQQWGESLRVEIATQFDNRMPKALGDSNQLLQVCIQLLGNCLHVMDGRAGRVVTVGTVRQADVSVLHITTEPMPALASLHADAAWPVDPEDSLGLTACQGILEEHRGQILRERREDGTLALRVELPTAETTPASEKDARGLWPSQPFA